MFKKLCMLILTLSNVYCCASWRETINQSKLAGPMITVQAHVVNARNQLLLGREKNSGQYSLPYAGIGKDVRSLENAVVSIVFENTRIIAHDPHFYGNNTVRMDHDSEDSERLLRILYVVKNFTGEPRVTNLSSDYDSWRWFGKDEIPHNLNVMISPRDQLKDIVKSYENMISINIVVNK